MKWIQNAFIWVISSLYVLNEGSRWGSGGGIFELHNIYYSYSVYRNNWLTQNHICVSAGIGPWWVNTWASHCRCWASARRATTGTSCIRPGPSGRAGRPSPSTPTALAAGTSTCCPWPRQSVKNIHSNQFQADFRPDFRTGLFFERRIRFFSVFRIGIRVDPFHFKLPDQTPDKNHRKNIKLQTL